MYYEQLAPHAALRPHIRSYFHIRLEGRTVHLPADGCPGLVVSLGNPFLLGAGDGSLETFSECRLFGAFTRQMLSRHAGRTEILAVKFFPGQFARFSGVPGIELSDGSASIEALWGAAGRELQHRLLDAKSMAEMVALLDRALLARLSERQTTDDRISAALRVILQRNGEVRIESLGRYVGLSRRHLERRFLEAVGLTPKRLCRIVRFSRAFSRLDGCGGRDWAAIALACGYADQAHLIRECRFFTGLSPLAYLRQRSSLEHTLLGPGEEMSHFFNTPAASSATI